MITSKHLFIGIVLLGISIFCTAQEVKIEFSYDKPNNSLTLILTNQWFVIKLYSLRYSCCPIGSYIN